MLHAQKDTLSDIWQRETPELLQSHVNGKCSLCKTKNSILELSVEGSEQDGSVYFNVCHACNMKSADVLSDILKKGSCVLCGKDADVDYSLQTSYEAQGGFTFLKLGCSTVCYRILHGMTMNADNQGTFCGICRSCGQETDKTCAKCQIEYYCSKRCSREDKERHQSQCVACCLTQKSNPAAQESKNSFELFSTVCEKLNQLHVQILVTARYMGWPSSVAIFITAKTPQHQRS